ncbi:hypothetical protein BV133_862 [Blastochloris viridis]|uniref:Uncharacterized protein n=1 Tax=Blastochloris viridis TaxID=1079 RepID=A0A182CYZ8_BLAVI|nr:hypothetical protein BV133_862 [Blastochloris viridis]
MAQALNFGYQDIRAHRTIRRFIRNPPDQTGASPSSRREIPF